MIEAILGIINAELRSIDVPYEFMRWTADLNDPYWVGEYLDSPTLNEDGAEEYTIMLTGTTNSAWLELMQQGTKIKDHFPSAGGFRKATDDGAVVIFYDQGFPVPTGEANLKRFQVNLQVKAWKGLK
jgi:hypothetical protein